MSTNVDRRDCSCSMVSGDGDAVDVDVDVDIRRDEEGGGKGKGMAAPVLGLLVDEVDFEFAPPALPASGLAMMPLL